MLLEWLLDEEKIKSADIYKQTNKHKHSISSVLGSEIRHGIFWGLIFDPGIFLGFVGSPGDFFGFWFLPPFDHPQHLKSGSPPPPGPMRILLSIFNHTTLNKGFSKSGGETKSDSVSRHPRMLWWPSLNFSLPVPFCYFSDISVLRHTSRSPTRGKKCLQTRLHNNIALLPFAIS